MTTSYAGNLPLHNIPGDPLHVQFFTLQNGLKLFLSVNKDEPRIFTNIAVRAGSKFDPSETTGLAHYLEHMMFKGTSRIGALDWEKESALLQQISDLYEAHRNTDDPTERRRLYTEIDRVSGEAAKIVAANEYDKAAKALGAKATNAYTWVEQTVYVNDIPNNELERWMRLESERFSMTALRLFHTELETVYEEFNISQDRDFRKVLYSTYEALFPTHPYGTQTTMGKGEHLKSPSHVKIQEFFKKYYVANNIAIVASGDFDPTEFVRLAQKYWGDYPNKPFDKPIFELQTDLKQVERREILGQEAEYVSLSWKADGASSQDALLLSLVGTMLYNGQAGLIDTNLVQGQQAIEPRAYANSFEEYSMLTMSAKPRQEQTLEELETLLTAQIALLREGNFPDWLIEGSIKDMKLNELRGSESNQNRVGVLTATFVTGMDWQAVVQRFDALATVTKAEVMDFCQKKLRADNYVVLYKRVGTDANTMKVEKPPITPVEVNREAVSEFVRDLLQTNTEPLKPEFVDFKTAIQKKRLKKGVNLHYIEASPKSPPKEGTLRDGYPKPEPVATKSSLPFGEGRGGASGGGLFTLQYIFEIGKNQDKKLHLALQYLTFLGTEKKSLVELQQAFFKLGTYFSIQPQEERIVLTISGLEDSLEESILLLNSLFQEVKGDKNALKNIISDMLSKRADEKKNKQIILQNALLSYAKYGKKSPFTDVLQADELAALTSEELLEKVKTLFDYEHTVFFYGQTSLKSIAKLLQVAQNQEKTLQKPPKPNTYKELPTLKNKVLFLDFPMVQVELLFLSKGSTQFDLYQHAMAELYNSYFGYGLSSIVFQEIREARALAYSTYVYYSSPVKKNRAHYLRGYVGTQPDKLQEALTSLYGIIEAMPISEQQINQARLSLLKRIESERITRTNIYKNYRNNLSLGVATDLRQPLYETMQQLQPNDLATFHDTYVKGRNYTLVVLGDKRHVDMALLQQFGTVQEVTLDDIFVTT
jgi:predicted Zn-dependent peptidase